MLNVRIRLTNGTVLNYNHVTQMVPMKNSVEFHVVGALDCIVQGGYDGEDLLNYINKRLDEIDARNFNGLTMLIDLEDLYE